MAATSSRRSLSPGLLLGRTAPHLVMILACVICLAPVIWMYLGSVKTFAELTRNPPTFLPVAPTLKNFEIILFKVNFLRGFLNSSLQASAVTISVLITSAAAGYVFATYRFWGREFLFTLLLATMMVPFAVVLVPLYVTISRAGLVNKLPALIVTGLCSTFGIFMMRQFLEGIPTELIDAARIDGASEFRIFGQVVLPLMGAPLASLAVFTFMGNWDSFLWPLVVLNSPQVKTLPLMLASLQGLYWTSYELYAAGSVVTITPVIVFYALAQRQFIRGIAMTGLKA